MAGTYAYTPEIWLPLAAAVFLAILGLYGWRRRDVPAARLLAINALLGVLWMVGLVFVAAAVDPGTKIAWHRFQAIWGLPTATAMTCFTLEYVYPGRWLTRRNLVLLWIPPLIALLLIVIDGGRFMWRSLEIRPDGWITPDYTTLALVLLAYAQALVLVNVAALLWLFVRSPQHRWPAALMLFGQVVARAGYLYGTVLLPETAWPEPQVLAAVVPWTVYAIALFGFSRLDPMPAARTVAFEQMQEGMVVFDALGRVASLNPSAAIALSIPAGRARGKTLQELLPAFPGPIARIIATQCSTEGQSGIPENAPLRTDIVLSAGPESKCYALDVSLLKDFRGLTTGRLLLLRDVTEERRAEARALEQQRTLAVIHERERLARELHDDVGQVLAFVNTQGQTVRRLLARGEVEAADECAGRLVEVAREADTDIRESILGLRVALGGQGLLPALRTYLEQYEKRYGIRTALSSPDTLGPGAFEPHVEVQLLRIIQEALANARKHAHAGSVCVAFGVQDGCARVTVQDDGCGFEPGEVAGDGGGHVGLRVMCERAEEIGGSFAVASAAGQGTTIVVTVPLIARCL